MGLKGSGGSETSELQILNVIKLQPSLGTLRKGITSTGQGTSRIGTRFTAIKEHMFSSLIRAATTSTELPENIAVLKNHACLHDDQNS